MFNELIVRGLQHFVNDFSEVFSKAYGVFDGHDDGNAANAGSEWVDLTRHQVFQVYETLGICGETLSHFGYTLPLSIRVGGSALPLLVWGIQHYVVDGPHAGARKLLPQARELTKTMTDKRVIQLSKDLEQQAEKPDSYASHFVDLVHSHIGDACLVVAIAHSLVLVGLGKRLQGSIILGFALYAPVEKRVPHQVRMPIRLILQHVALVNDLCYGNWVDRVFSGASLISLASFWAQTLGIKLTKLPSKPVAEDKVYKESELQLSGWHWKAYESPAVKIPNEGVELTSLDEMVKSINWSEELFANHLKEHIENDGEWKKLPVESRGSMEAFMKKGMERFLDSMINKKADQGGELGDWDQVIAKAKHVILALKQRKPRYQSRYLIRLSVAAGWYCADAYKRVVNDCYKELCDPPADDLGGAISKALAGLRAKKFNEVLHNPPNWMQPFMALFNIYDDHNENLAIWVFGSMTGHPGLAEANKDLHMASGHWLDKIILRAGWNGFSTQFWQGYKTETGEEIEGYSVKAVVDEVRQATRIESSVNATPVISFSWVQEWLQKKHPSEPLTSFYNEDSWILNQEVIVEMLVDQGVLVPNPVHS